MPLEGSFQTSYQISSSLRPQEMYIPDLKRPMKAGQFAFNGPIGAGTQAGIPGVAIGQEISRSAGRQERTRRHPDRAGVRVTGQGSGRSRRPRTPDQRDHPGRAQARKSAEFHARRPIRRAGSGPTNCRPESIRRLVGDFFHDENGKPTGYNSRLAPGVYPPLSFEVRDGQPAPD